MISVRRMVERRQLVTSTDSALRFSSSLRDRCTGLLRAHVGGVRSYRTRGEKPKADLAVSEAKRIGERESSTRYV